jgi:signal transduction histidine kinase
VRKSPAPQRKTNDRSSEAAALLAAARAVLENGAFADAARAVLGACKTILGADAGLVAVRAADGKGFDVALLDSGGLELSSAAGGLPAPLRRLSARASKGRTVFANGLSKRTAKKSPPGRRSVPERALLAPIIIAGDGAGLLGLIDKPGGFSAADCELAEVFAEMLAVAMLRYEAEQHARYVTDALREATVALTRSLDRETVLTTLLDRLRRMVPFDRASVMLVEEASRVSIRAVFDGDRVVPLTPEVRPELDPADHPIVHGILTTGTAVLIPDIRAHPEWSLPTDRSSEASWMGVPLFARGDVAGLFSLSKREPDYFNDEHMRVAEAMSSQASVAVENAVLFEQMQASAVRMQSLSRRLVEVQESERRNIARELHDEAGQALVSLRYGLRLLEREIGEGERVTERVAELVQRTDAVIDGLHRLAADLRPASLDHLGLEAALRQYSRSAGSKPGLAVRFKARGFTGERLPAAIETDLYRVAQEAMTNVVRHARATRVDVLVERRGDSVMVMVEDDGVGFEPDQVQRGDHFGLLGIRERAEALGGTLTVESAPGAGTTVVVEVPSADPHPDR